MIADHLDFFDCQAGGKIYVHTLFVAIWDLLYKSGRLLEESLHLPFSRYYSKGIHEPVQYVRLIQTRRRKLGNIL